MLSKNDNKNYKSLAVAEMGNRLATMDMGQKLVGVPLWGELGPVQCHLGRGLCAYPRNPAIAEGPRDAGVPVEIW